jgi:flagellar biosynthesis GTPase FlhF
LTEDVVVVCPNPKCKKEIEEPILLTIRSVTPPKQYDACPYCFAKLEQEPPVEQEIFPEPNPVEYEEVMDEGKEATSNESVKAVSEKANVSRPNFLKKVKALFPNSNGSQKERQKKTEELQTKSSSIEDNEHAVKEEPRGEPFFIEEETEEAPIIESSVEKKNQSSGCPETFGYLAKRPKDAPIPQQCMLCPKIVDCMLKLD